MTYRAEYFDYADFAGERLNIDELVERLEAAQQVVSGLQARHNLATGIIESYQATVRDRDAILMHQDSFMRRLAANLAGCVSSSHAGKNIVLLETISDLLTMADRKYPAQQPDDIPF